MSVSLCACSLGSGVPPHETDGCSTPLTDLRAPLSVFGLLTTASAPQADIWVPDAEDRC